MNDKPKPLGAWPPPTEKSVTESCHPLTAFETSFLAFDNVKRARHGNPWTAFELENLQHFFGLGYPLSEICGVLYRPAAGILPQLVKLGLLVVRGGVYYKTGQAAKQPQENLVKYGNTPVVQVKTFVAGVDASEMSDGDIFQLISKIEGEIQSWSSIKQRPKKLDELVDKLTNDVKCLVEYVDSRV